MFPISSWCGSYDNENNFHAANITFETLGTTATTNNCLVLFGDCK